MAVAIPVGVAVASVVRVVVVVVVSVLGALAIVEVVVAGHVEAVGCAVVCGLVVAEVVGVVAVVDAVMVGGSAQLSLGPVGSWVDLVVAAGEVGVVDAVVVVRVPSC